MRYFIKVCHPNEVIDRKWRTVDEFSHIDELASHLSSPSFDWYPTLCVRVVDNEHVILYDGIFNQTECVNVGPASEVMMKSKWPEKLRAFNDYMTMWSEVQDAEQLMFAVQDFLPREYIIAARIAIAKTALRLHPRSRFLKEAIEAYETTAVTGSHPRYGSLMNLLASTPMTDRIGDSAFVIYHTLSIGAISLDRCARYAERLYVNQSIVPDALRKAIPFHVIAEKIV